MAVDCAKNTPDPALAVCLFAGESAVADWTIANADGTDYDLAAQRVTFFVVDLAGDVKFFDRSDGANVTITTTDPAAGTWTITEVNTATLTPGESYRWGCVLDDGAGASPVTVVNGQTFDIPANGPPFATILA